MEKKNIGLGVAALAAGAGAVALAAKNHKNNVKNEVKKAAANAPELRIGFINTGVHR